MKQLKIILLTALIFVSTNAFSFDAVGHRIVADIAYQNLTEKARSQVNHLLGKRGLVYDATWADDIKSDSKYAYSYSWHFQDLDDSLTFDNLAKLVKNPKAEGKHLFYAIDSLAAALRKNPNNAEALKFLVHFVGDLHQPLHLGRKDDKGGNSVDYNWFGKKTNLHAVWDSYLIDNRHFSYSEYSQYLQDKFESRKLPVKTFDMLNTAWAVYQVRCQVYAYNYSDTSNYHYSYRFNQAMDEMLYRGGIQLAALLNSIYK